MYGLNLVGKGLGLNWTLLIRVKGSHYVSWRLKLGQVMSCSVFYSERMRLIISQ